MGPEKWSLDTAPHSLKGALSLYFPVSFFSFCHCRTASLHWFRVIFCSAGHRTQGLAHARKAPCPEVWKLRPGEGQPLPRARAPRGVRKIARVASARAAQALPLFGAPPQILFSSTQAPESALGSNGYGEMIREAHPVSVTVFRLWTELTACTPPGSNGPPVSQCAGKQGGNCPAPGRPEHLC